MSARFVPVLLAGVLLAALPAAAAEPDRTANRTVPGRMEQDAKYRLEQPFAEFSAAKSNHDVYDQHPAQWDGQDWDPAAWGGKTPDGRAWTPEVVIENLYRNRTFHRQYNRDKKIAVLEVGPMFYKLSDLDRRRALKLLFDHEQLAASVNPMIELRDWRTQKVVGSYTQQGMVLN